MLDQLTLTFHKPVAEQQKEMADLTVGNRDLHQEQINLKEK